MKIIFYFIFPYVSQIKNPEIYFFFVYILFIFLTWLKLARVETSDGKDPVTCHREFMLTQLFVSDSRTNLDKWRPFVWPSNLTATVFRWSQLPVAGHARRYLASRNRESLEECQCDSAFTWCPLFIPKSKVSLTTTATHFPLFHQVWSQSRTVLN